MPHINLTPIIRSAIYICITSVGFYVIFLGVLTIPLFQNQIIYLNRVTLTWFQDVNVPEQWGFLRNQVTPFNLRTEDGETLHAWHILPLQLYGQHEEELLEEPSGLAPDIKNRLGFKLLRDDPSSLLVLYFHGAAGTLGSGWRPPSYRAMSAGEPGRIHTIAIDYRGFGESTGVPSEEGLLKDAVALAKFAMEEAGIPPSRIVLFAQSLGTAVSISLTNHMANLPEPVLFSGMVLVAPFANVEMLTATYRVAGIIPILDPIAKFPRLLAWLNTLILSKWPSKDALADFVRRCEGMDGNALKYHITVIHAEDDYDIPWSHSEQVFWHAVNASSPNGISYDELERDKEASKVMRGAGGWVVDQRTMKGVIREEIMKYGLHDRIMSYPVVSSAILRAFRDLGR
ncbi:alpha/beta-hydrolase [Hypoxylon rubiginosum]|uniref:Alpha/beta-hydrolase n=1 Tax=Hypoxylon rubiginosum TaxID=110542 RepID=A0ACC0CZ44_9PEZI|nr:alpha/beta-hydrolase [Hypoxylon rubiginosum]